jgi:hypothetical protein
MTNANKMTLAEELRYTAKAPTTHPAWSVASQLSRAADGIDERDRVLDMVAHTLEVALYPDRETLTHMARECRKAITGGGVS